MIQFGDVCGQLPPRYLRRGDAMPPTLWPRLYATAVNKSNYTWRTKWAAVPDEQSLNRHDVCVSSCNACACVEAGARFHYVKWHLTWPINSVTSRTRPFLLSNRNDKHEQDSVNKLRIGIYTLTPILPTGLMSCYFCRNTGWRDATTIYDLYVVGQHVVLCEVKWWIFVASI